METQSSETRKKDTRTLSASKSLGETISINLPPKDVEEHSNTNEFSAVHGVQGATYGEQQRIAL